MNKIFHYFLPDCGTFTPLYQFSNGDLIAEVDNYGFLKINFNEKNFEKIMEIGETEDNSDNIFLGVINSEKIEFLEEKNSEKFYVFISILEEKNGIFITGVSYSDKKISFKKNFNKHSRKF